VILVDTSAWVEFLRGTGSATDRRVDKLLAEAAPLATTDVVLMEILAGARDDAHGDQLRRLLARCDFAATEGPRDFEDAAGLYRACRRGGDTVRGLTDCLVASVALRAGLPVLHADADFDVIARHSPLRIA
jgi:predicted nucleic acid-binding protein